MEGNPNIVCEACDFTSRLTTFINQETLNEEDNVVMSTLTCPNCGDSTFVSITDTNTERTSAKLNEIYNELHELKQREVNRKNFIKSNKLHERRKVLLRQLRKQMEALEGEYAWAIPK